MDLTYFQTLSAISDSAGGYCYLLQAVQHCRRCSVAGSAGLQAVQRCRRCGVAGGKQVPPSLLGWYSNVKVVARKGQL